MKNISVRTRILVGVVLVNLLGALVVVVYLHQSYSGGLDVTAQKSLSLGLNSLDQVRKLDADRIGLTSDPKAAATYVESMKAVTGADYGLLLDKSQIDQAAYAKTRIAAGLVDNWDELQKYALIAITDEGLGDEMDFKASAGDVPESGRVVGIENGACARTCHGSMKQEGDYWRVTWSDDEKSEAHAVFPVAEGGKTVGVVYSIENISAQAISAKSSLMNTLLVIGVTLLVATVVIGGMLDTLIFRRLNRMITSMEDISVRVAGGDFDAHFEPDGSSDEIGTFESFFAKFMELMSNTLKALTGR